MMLRNLVKFRNDLREFADQLSVTAETLNKIDTLTHIKSNNPNVQYTFEDTIGHYQNILTLSNSVAISIKEQLDQVEKDIELAGGNLTNHTFDLNCINPAHRIPIESYTEKLFERVTTRIKTYCDWHYPALQLECREKIWADCMVTADPFYLASVTEDFVESIVQSYPPEYQRRLRVYNITKDSLSTFLPINQYNFILSWNVLEYASANDIELVIKQAWELLRPGGTFMFSYNNCDLEQSARLAEVYAMSFTHQRRIKAFAESIGFTVSAVENHTLEHELYQNISWIEIKKPGKLITSKGHQVLGKILHK